MRTAIFKSANALVGWLLQQAADQVDGAYQPKPGQVCKSSPINRARLFPLGQRKHRKLTLATDFVPRERDWWEGDGIIVPAAKLFMQRYESVSS